MDLMNKLHFELVMRLVSVNTAAGVTRLSLRDLGRVAFRIAL